MHISVSELITKPVKVFRPIYRRKFTGFRAWFSGWGVCQYSITGSRLNKILSSIGSKCRKSWRHIRGIEDDQIMKTTWKISAIFKENPLPLQLLGSSSRVSSVSLSIMFTEPVFSIDLCNLVSSLSVPTIVSLTAIMLSFISPVNFCLDIMVRPNVPKTKKDRRELGEVR